MYGGSDEVLQLTWHHFALSDYFEICLVQLQKTLASASKYGGSCTKAVTILVRVWTLVTTGTGNQTISYWHSLIGKSVSFELK